MLRICRRCCLGGCCWRVLGGGGAVGLGVGIGIGPWGCRVGVGFVVVVGIAHGIVPGIEAGRTRVVAVAVVVVVEVVVGRRLKDGWCSNLRMPLFASFACALAPVVLWVRGAVKRRRPEGGEVSGLRPLRLLLFLRGL